MTTYIDTHAHLYLPQFDQDRPQMLRRAWDAGVKHLFLPNIDSESIASLYQIVDDAPQQCYPMMGLHPCSVKENFTHELSIAEKELKHSGRRFYAVGEIGLDFYWDTTFTQQQYEALEAQIEWAKELNLPIVLHCRNSFDQTFEVVKRHCGSGKLSGVFHCFSGSVQDAKKVANLGNFYMGIGGTVTYKKSELPQVIQSIDLSYFVLETDAPYLAPEPYRSAKDALQKRNESLYIVNIAQKIAQIKGIDVENVARLTTENALKLFQINT